MLRAWHSVPLNKSKRLVSYNLHIDFLLTKVPDESGHLVKVLYRAALSYRIKIPKAIALQTFYHLHLVIPSMTYCFYWET